ncbi:hypothetical protein HPO96_10655 [Kribbella sandramycini]|uniref:PE-PGRS family protein n=1 Tax=Kribbella sandramycini TaxID=60450 RepID=A0A7Y4KZH3_9ACTN|nr:hypothetical protein [Kribbella sandramycini]MBB6569460.1 hypothetical protein [Kribbella sandramycini]NOL40706.1 hypothetical protein [Kribbella sandramycini]
MPRNELTDAQLDLLNRIADGDDLSSPEGVAYRTSARALQRRHLVDVTRKGGVWRARITAAGRDYLEQGPPPKQPPPARAKRAVGTGSGPDVEQARRFIERLRAEGDTLRLPNPTADERAGYRRLLHLCKQEGLVPDGLELLHTGRDQGDLIIRLSQGRPVDVTDWNRIRLNIRRTITDPQALLAVVTERPQCLNVTESSMPRAIKFIGSLAKAAVAAGYSIGVNTKPQAPKIFFQAGHWQRELILEEEYDEVRHVTTEEDRRALRGRFWRPPPAYEKVACGRLKLQIGRARSDEKYTWTDLKGARLERRLGDIMTELREGLAEDERVRLEAEREWVQQQARWARQEAEERSQWRAAMISARGLALEDVRRSKFRQAYDQWTAADQIRTFCSALERAASHPNAEHLPQWIEWARAAADALDPATTPDQLDDIDREPQPDDLRPYLNGWSPLKPEKEYRTLSPRPRARVNWWHQHAVDAEGRQS